MNQGKSEKKLDVEMIVERNKETDDIVINGYKRRDVINCHALSKFFYYRLRYFLLRMFSRA